MWGGNRLLFRRGGRDYDEDVDSPGGGSELEDEHSESDSESGSESPKSKKLKSGNQAFKLKVHKVLRKITDCAAGEFAIYGDLPQAPTIVISLKNGEIMKFPMYETEYTTANIIKAFEQSPYGKGTETIVDTSFRNSWQLNPDGFTILNPAWDAFVKSVLVPLVKKEMAIESPFNASLYKLLLYKEGSFFKPHRDSEKEPRMFGTLVVQLPSKYSGGQLVVNHDNKTKTFFGDSSEFSTSFSAFYCDCQHEILPLTSGIRVCLIYNLALEGDNSPATLTAPVTSDAEQQLVSLISDWRRMHKKDPTKIIYALAHRYTLSNLSFDNMKAKDKAVAKMLTQISVGHRLTVLLAILHKSTHGTPNCEDSFDSSDEDCYCESSYSLDNLKFLGILDTPADVSNKGFAVIKTLGVDLESELIPEKIFKQIKPYNEEREETGNEGVNVELSYRHAALVFWPEEFTIQILIGESKFNAAEEIFLKEFHKMKAAHYEIDITTETGAKLLRWAKSLALGKVTQYSSQDSANAQALLSAIIDFNDKALLLDFLKNHDVITPAKFTLLMPQCKKYGWSSELSAQLVAMFKKIPGKARNALGMLEMVIGNHTSVAKVSVEKKTICQTLCQAVLDLHITNTKDRTEHRYSYSFYSSLPARTQADKLADIEADKKFLFDFWIIANRIDFKMEEFAKTQPVSIIVPILLRLAWEASSEFVLDENWLEIAVSLLKKLKEITGKPVVVPDWRRTDFRACGCNDCSVVQVFMMSNNITQGFKMGKMRRLHLHRIFNGMCDITHVTITERFGNPQTMFVTKTDKQTPEDYLDREVAVELLPQLEAIIQDKQQERSNMTNQ